MDTGTTFESPAGASVPAYLSVTLSVLLLLLPFGFWVPLAATGEITAGATWYRWVSMRLPLDLVWLVFTIMTIPVVVRRLRSSGRPWGLIVMVAFTILGVVALIVNPTLLGTTFVARWIASIGLVAVVSAYSRPEFRTVVAVPLIISGILQALIGLWQNPGPGAGFRYYGDHVVNRGTLEHHVDLAMFLVFVITVAAATLPTRGKARIVWFVSIGVMSAAVAGTLSRTGAVALALVWAAYAWGLFRDRRLYGPVLATSTIPFLVTVGFTASGWLRRLEQSTSGSAAGRTSGRTELIRAAFSIVHDHPLFGVGPGRYVAELIPLRPTWNGYWVVPVHLTPLFAAAELGVAAGVLLVATIVGFGWRALRSSPAALAVFASITVFLLLEQRTYYIATDVAIFAVWLATLDVLADRNQEALPEASS